MLKAICFAAASLMSSATLAQTASTGGPPPAIDGLRPGPAKPVGPIERDAQRCDAMHGEAKERCLRELRAAMRAPQRDPHEGPGPEALGGTPAGSGATSGTAGGSGVGAAAPR